MLKVWHTKHHKVWEIWTRNMVLGTVSSWKDNLQIQYHFTGINTVYFFDVRLEMWQFEDNTHGKVWFGLNTCSKSTPWARSKQFVPTQSEIQWLPCVMCYLVQIMNTLPDCDIYIMTLKAGYHNSITRQAAPLWLSCPLNMIVPEMSEAMNSLTVSSIPHNKILVLGERVTLIWVIIILTRHRKLEVLSFPSQHSTILWK